MSKTMPRIVSHQEWVEARKQLLEKEKEWSRLRAEWSEERRRLPMEEVEQSYSFQGADGAVSLSGLFGDQPQLVVYHFMFEPEHRAGCPNCTFVMDHLQSTLPHLAAANTAFAAISRAPLEKLERYKERMGWDFPWYSSFGTSFNYDFQVTIDAEQPYNNYRHAFRDPEVQGKGPTEGEAPGLSVFLKEQDRIYHSYSTYLRGLDIFLNTFNVLDHTPLGRQEENGTMAWVRRRDEY